jgi:uncharacterized protein UPF0547
MRSEAATVSERVLSMERCAGPHGSARPTNPRPSYADPVLVLADSAQTLGTVIGVAFVLLTIYVVGMTIRGRTTKWCPDCDEAVSKNANVCKHCGYRFDAATPAP